jgi:hypothetical protein
MAWSQFFGKVTGRSSTAGTRVGTKDSGLSLIAASKTGAVTVELNHWGGKNCFEIRLTDWGDSKFDDIVLARGSFTEGEGKPVIMLDDAVVRAHVEREALKAMTKED